MVSTKHCCWGKCKSDSRYPDKLPKSLKELKESGKKFFIPFPKPSQDIEKCKRWLVACSREFFTVKNITRNTYICALHWPGEKGPTAEFPDPLKASLSPAQERRARAPRRKAPKSRAEPVAKIEKLVNEKCGNEFCESLESKYTIDESSVGQDCDFFLHVYEGCQTLYSKYELSAKVETKILKNETYTTKLQPPEIVSTLSYENVSRDPGLMKHFSGLSSPQFELLHNFLDDVCPLHTIHYWTSKDCPATENAGTGPKSEFSSREKLFICLLRLRRRFTLKTLAALLSTPERKIDPSYVRKMFTTFIQLMYVTFRDMQKFMFPERAQLAEFLPKVFKTMKKIRCIVDYTEFRVECSRNFVMGTLSLHTNTQTHSSALLL